MADEGTITSIGIAARADTKDAEARITALTNKLERLQSVAGKQSSFTAFSEEALASIDAATQKMENLAKAASQVGNMKIKAPEMADVKKEGGDTSGEQERAAEAVMKHASAWGKLASAVAVAGKYIGKASLQFGKIAGKIALAPWKALGNAVKNATTRLKNFLSAIKRIALYRAIRAALKAITQGFKEGMQNLYQYSLLIDGKFKNSMDSLATSALYAKNSLGAMAAPLVNALAPVVDMLVDKFVDLLNVINQLFATLTGASTWTKALKYPTEYAEAADKAGGAAKKLKATILGFDEINKLDDNSSGGRGGGAEGLDYSKMFEEQSVGSFAQNIANSLKNAFESADFTGIGTIIGTQIAEALNSINWTKIKSKASKASKSVATFLNGLFETPGLASSIGKSIAETINTASVSIGDFFGTVHWDSLGTFVADGINSAFKNIDAKALAKALSEPVKGAIKGVTAFIQDIDFVGIGKKVGECIRNIDWGGAVKDLGHMIAIAIKRLPDLAEGAGHIVDALLAGIGDIIPQLPGVIWEIIKAIGECIAGLWDLIKRQGKFIGEKIAEGLGDAWHSLKKGAGNLVTNIGLGISEKYQELRQKSFEIVDTVVSAIEDGFWKVVKAGKNIVEKLWEGISSGWQWLKDKVNGITDWLGDKLSFIPGIGGNSGSHSSNGGGHSFAGGGTAQTGELFLARESGPELVAQVGHKTQIANNDQITESIKMATMAGNAESNMILREVVSVLRSIYAKDNVVVANITTDSITDGLSRQNRRNGRTTIPIGG